MQMRSVANLQLPVKARLLRTSKLNSIAALGMQSAATSATLSVLRKPSAQPKASLHSAVNIANNTARTSRPPERAFTPALAAAAAANRNCEKRPSKHTQSNCLPCWQANLAVLAVGAIVVSANTHQVPITGRRQFMLGFMQTPIASRSSSGHPADLYFRCRQETEPALQVLQEQGLQIMQNMYQTAALGVARLAATDSTLQKRLQMLPNCVVLQHDVNHICPQASIQWITEGKGGELSSGPLPSWVSGQQQHMRIQASGGGLLVCRTHEEGVWTMSHELAHGIACHAAESASWVLMALLLAAARLLLGGCTWWSLLAIPLLLLTFTNKFLVGVWLSQQQEYEADAIGAVISKAAGCSSESIVASMQRWHAAQLHLRDMSCKTYADSAALQMQEELATLQQLLPSGQHLPEQVNTSKEFGVIAQYVEHELKHVPSAVQEKAAVLMVQLQHSLGKRLFVCRDMLQDRLSSHPHGLDRIKKVKEVLASLAREPVVPDVPEGLSAECGVDFGVQTSGLLEYQAVDRWGEALHQDKDCIEVWQVLQQIRSYQPSALECVMRKGALELYDKEIRDIAWKEAVSRDKAIQQLLKHFKDASFIH